MAVIVNMATRHTLVIMTRDQDEFEELFQTMELPDLEVIVPKTDAEIALAIPQATIILGEPPRVAPWLDKAVKLEWLQSKFSGVDALIGPDMRKDYLLTNIRDTYGPAIAAYTMGYILYFLREIQENLEQQSQKGWQKKPYPELTGRVMSILGAGSIGTEIARVAKTFGMKTLGYKRSPDPVEHFDEIHSGVAGLNKLLECGDYVVNILPHTDATIDVINAETLRLMKRSAIFINVGRGSAVDEEALVAAINEGVIAKAVLDVFKTEPLPPESPLWTTENIIITPHISGDIMSGRFGEIFAQNYRRFVAGEELLYVVDLEQGY